jgi:hypothetical protein
MKNTVYVYIVYIEEVAIELTRWWHMSLLYKYISRVIDRCRIELNTVYTYVVDVGAVQKQLTRRWYMSARSSTKTINA